MVIKYTDWQQALLDEANCEFRDNDDVINNFRYCSFYSKSKGGHRNKIVKSKNGKIYGPYPHYGPYKRKHWKDIELVSYQGGRFHLWHRFPFDQVVTEVFHDWEEWKAIDYLMDALRKAF